MGIAGPWSWFVGGGGGRSSPFMVVGTWHVFVVLVYCLQALNLPWSFLSWRDVAADGQGRGDIEGANRQPPVGGRQWWCCVSGVGGNGHGGVAYPSAIKRNDDVVPHRSVLHGCNVAQQKTYSRGIFYYRWIFFFNLWSYYKRE